MANITLYTKPDLRPLLKRLRSALKAEGATLSAWFDRLVREAVESKKP